MRTKPQHVNRGLAGPGAAPAAGAEAAVLLALVTCPALLVPFAENPFEPHKATFLWAAVMSAAAALIVGGVGNARRLLETGTAGRWIAMTVLASTIATTISASLSRSPALAWWGSGLRRYGALTELALVSVAVITALLAADRDRFERWTAAIVLGSIGPTIYALMQWTGIDPLMSGGLSQPRPGSTFGNPLFLSGYLAAAFPVTLGHATSSTRPVRRMGSWLLVGLQGAALVAARSIGPLLALGAAAAIIGAAVLVPLGRRRAAAVIGLALASTATVVAISAPQRLRAWTSSRNAIQTAQLPKGTTMLVRAMLWQSGGLGIENRRRGLAFGSGPESTTEVLTKYSGTALQMIEGAAAAPDRAHNETIETVLSFGIVGLGLRLALYCASLAAAFVAFGLLPPADYWRFGAFALLTFLALPAFAWWRDGAWTIAVSVPAALVATASLWVVWRRRSYTVLNRSAIGPVAATAIAGLTYYFEVQTGIPSVGSSLVGCAALALTIARANAASEPASALLDASSRSAGCDDALSLLAGWASAVVFMSLAGAANANAPSVWAIAVLTWGCANLFLGARKRSLTISGGTAACLALVWLALPIAAATPVAQAGGLVARVIVFYAMSASASICVAWRLARHVEDRARGDVALSTGARMPPGRRAVAGRPGAIRVVAMSIVPIVMVAVPVARAAIPVSTADVRLGVGRACEARLDFGCARTLFMSATQDDRTDVRSAVRLADLLANEADSIGGDRRDALFGDAAVQLARAWSVDPFDYGHARNRGALERQWARRLPVSGRGPHLEAADRWYAVAAGLAPASPNLWEEWANLGLERGRPEDALPRLERALTLGVPTNEGAALGDAWLREIGIAPDPGGFAQAVEEFHRRGYPKLAGLYAARAAKAAGNR